MEVDDEASAPESSSSDTSLTSLITIYQYPPPCPLLYSSKYYNHSCFQFLDSSLDGSVQIGKPPFQLQFLTDHERRNRLICLHVAALSRKPNEKISHSFPSVPVMTTDGIQGLKYPFFPLIHYSNLVAIKSFLHIPMPYYFTYTTIIMRNDVSQGLLHTLLRHPEQWWDHIYDLRALLKKPPNFNQKKPTKPSKKKPTKLNSKIWAVTDKNYEYDLFDFEDDMRTFSNKYYLRLSKMQMLIYEYLISHISSGTYEGEGCSNDGRMSILFAVYNDKMRIGLTDRIFGANGRVGDEYQRRIRLIKTATDQFTEYTPYDDKVCITDDDEKRKRLKALHNNARYGKPNDKLSRKFPDVPVVTYHGIHALKNCPFYPHNACLFFITTKAFLPVKMPYFFNYTTIVMSNNVRQGLLHTLLRHPREWSNQIYDLGILLKARDHLNRHIWGVTNKRYKNYLLKNFENAMQNFTYAEFLLLNKMQMYIYEYFKLNMVQANYTGEGCSDDGTMNVLFRVPNDCMLVGLSNVVIGANRRTGDHRRIRLITTAFFNEFLNPLVTLQQPTS